MNQIRPTANERSLEVVWEPTRACDLACVHCRTSVQPRRSSYELTTEEGYQLIDQVAELGPARLVLSGGDPLKRPDIFNFVEYARLRGLEVSLALSATPLLSENVLRELKYRRLNAVSVNIDGPTAESHDGQRGTPGAFDQTLSAIAEARDVGLAVEVATMLTRQAAGSIEQIAALLAKLGVSLWSLHFLVPTPRSNPADMITAQETEELFERLSLIREALPFEIETPEARHFLRFLAEQNQETPREAKVSQASLFVSHLGEVYPSGFLPLSAGNVRRRPLGEIVREAPLFVSLRDTALLKGKCGVCEYREACGGSRARAYAMTGDPLAEEPLCVYVPRSMRAGGA
jgi:AdoMet-dependent heme synthase